MAERHVVEGERLVGQQRELIQRLSERGLPTDRAGSVLERLERSLQRHRDHLNRLLNSG